MIRLALRKKEELKKNRLDLEFQSLSQKLNAILILAAVGVLSFIGVFIWHKERLIVGFFIVAGVLFLLYRGYYDIKSEMNNILIKIEEI